MAAMGFATFLPWYLGAEPCTGSNIEGNSRVGLMFAEGATPIVPAMAGKGIANPIGQIWSGAMMLEHLGYPKAAAAVEAATETVLAEPALRTPDMGGKTTTSELGSAIVDAI